MVEKSLGTYYSRYFKMPDVRRQDLQEMEDLILKDLHPDRYHIACQGFIYNRVSDIPVDSAEVVTLVIYTHSPCLRLKFARSWAELYCEENNETISPAVERLGSIVMSRERQTRWTLSKFSAWTAPMVGFGMLCEAVILVAFTNAPVMTVTFGVALLLISFAWWVVSYRATLFRYSRIRLGE